MLEVCSPKSSRELAVKRNSVVYLSEILKKQGNNEEVQNRLIDIQKVFQRFLFDRRGSMQDLASKALPQIYLLGSEEVKKQLMENLKE
jgi:hypothetical protein